MPGGYKKITGSDGKLFVKGDSRINLNGRPRKLDLDKLLRKALARRINNKSAISVILDRLVFEAAKGDIRAAEVLLDRYFGKPKTTVETTGKMAVVQIQYIIPENGDNIKADAEAARVLRGPEDE